MLQLGRYSREIQYYNYIVYIVIYTILYTLHALLERDVNFTKYI